MGEMSQILPESFADLRESQMGENVQLLDF